MFGTQPTVRSPTRAAECGERFGETGRDGERRGETGRDGERLGETGRDGERLGGTGRDWETLVVGWTLSLLCISKYKQNVC